MKTITVNVSPFHRGADALLSRLLDEGHDFALVPQTLAEFIHVVTDGRRMPNPLEMAEACLRAEHWWESAEVLRVFPIGGGWGMRIEDWRSVCPVGAWGRTDSGLLK